MDPFSAMAWGAFFLFGGVWGTMTLRTVLRRVGGPGSRPADDPQLAQAAEERRLLELRLEQVEEELSFLRELRSPADRPSLPPSGEGNAPGGAV
jgi:hypothetical protein